jgi:hypothetical protein
MLLAIAPLLIGFSYQRLRASGAALSDGNCQLAKHRAFSSISLLAVRPQAYEVIGYCDLEQGYPIEALAAMNKAVAYDRQAWDYHFGLAMAQAANGIDPRPEAREAHRLDPREGLTKFEQDLFAKGNPALWERLAPAALIKALQGDVSVTHL